MSKALKIGDKVVVTKCICGHEFDIGDIGDIGDIVVVVEVYSTDYRCINSSGEYWYLIDTEFETYKE